MVILDTKTKTILGKNTNWYREESSINATVADYAVNYTAAISLSVREDPDLRAHHRDHKPTTHEAFRPANVIPNRGLDAVPNGGGKPIERMGRKLPGI